MMMNARVSTLTQVDRPVFPHSPCVTELCHLGEGTLSIGVLRFTVPILTQLVSLLDRLHKCAHHQEGSRDCLTGK